MGFSAPIKAVLVALATGGCLLHTDAGLGRTLALALAAGLVTFAWLVFASPRPATGRAGRPAAGAFTERRQGAAEERIRRTPTGRGPRDVRCPASRATAWGRRSTRR